MEATSDPSVQRPTSRKRDRCEEPVLTLSCLTRLGQFGNQLFQYAFLRVIGDANTLCTRVPQWLGAKVFGLSDADGTEPWHQLPLVADRVILSHPGWRQWAVSREPLATLVREHGKRLSGRQLRERFPQVSGASLGDATACAAACGNADLWGWFQFNTAVWAQHMLVWQDTFNTVPPLQAALTAVLQRLFHCDSATQPLRVVVHLRAGSTGAGGSGPTPPPPVGGESANSPHPPADWTWTEWEDRNTFWPAPTEWYLRWLIEQADTGTFQDMAKAHRPFLLVCSDVEAGATQLRDAVRGRLGQCYNVRSWDSVLETAEYVELRRVWRAVVGGGSGDAMGASNQSCTPDYADENTLALFRDWWAMGQADVLAVSNSTFSFTAAMMNKVNREPLSCHNTESVSAAARPRTLPYQRFWRPVPSACSLQPLDPWSAQPLLQCSDEERAALYGTRGAYA